MQKKEKTLSWPPFATTDSVATNTSPLPQSQKIQKQNKVKLWDLVHNYHCAIIGTCLTMAEVKKILGQLNIGSNGFSTYELHTTIVSIISENNFPSKKVQNYLDKKFKSTVQKTRKMNADELKGFWKAALYCGDIIAAFWAVMSHPESDEAMKKTSYGDIHMLSHMSGASNRADLKRLSLLEKEREKHITEMRSWETKCNKLATENSRLLNNAKAHQEQRSDLENHVTALKNSLDQLLILQSTKDRQELENQLEKLNIKINYQANELAKHQDKDKQLSKLVSHQKHQIMTNKAELLAYQNEVEYLHAILVEKPQSSCPLQKRGLCGQCVLYVGGKTNLIPHYRELVEEKSGVFIHHDGGIEKNTQDLQQSLSKADVVVFPSSCISHDAYWKIKRSCKKQHKPYQYLKSSGLYSLSDVLDKIMAKTEVTDVGMTKNVGI